MGNLGTLHKNHPVADIHVIQHAKGKIKNQLNLRETCKMNITLYANDVILLESICHLNTINKTRFIESNDAMLW